MAFVSRAPRDFSIKKDQDGIGPGSYVGHQEYKQNLSYAPFSSLTERQTVVADAQKQAKLAPGPGFYSSNLGFEKIQQDQESMKTIQKQGLDRLGVKLIRPNCNFASKVERFTDKTSPKAEKEIRPEPGQYQLPDQWAKKSGCKMNKSKSH